MPQFGDNTKVTDDAWARLLQSLPASYTLWVDGSTYRAECNVSGGTDYSGTDACEVIQAAIDALSTSGGKIFFQPGTYVLEGVYPNNIRLASNIILEGAGYKTCFQGIVWGASELVRIEDKVNIIIKRIRFCETSAAKPADKASYTNGIGISGASSNIIIENCWCEDMGGAGITIQVNSAETTESIKIINNNVASCGRVSTLPFPGIFFAVAHASAVIQDVIIQNNEVWYNGTRGIFLNWQAGTMKQIEATHNYISENGKDIDLYPGIDEYPANAGLDYNTFKDNIVYDNWDPQIRATGTHTVVKDNTGYNPVGIITNPYPAATGNLTNLEAAQAYPTSEAVYTVVYTPKTVIVGGGTISAIDVNGLTTGLTSGVFHLGVGETIKVTHSVNPTINQVRAE